MTDYHTDRPTSTASRPARAACLGRVLAVGFGLLVALALVEIGGRALLGFEPLPRWAQDFQAQVGYELRPHQEYTYASVSGEFENRVKNNRRGLHDIERPLTKPENTFRVLILADSYGQAREVPLEENFARQLAARLNAAAPDGITVDVINAGHFGLGTTQEYLYYREEGHRYDPDLVLLGFYAGNDVVDNHAPLIKAWNGVDRVEFPYFDPDGTLHQPGLAAQRRVFSWLRHNIYVVHTLSETLGGTGLPERVEVGEPDTVTARALRVPAGVYLPPDAVWQDAWAVTGVALDHLHNAVTADGAQLAVFIIPDRRQVHDEDWQTLLDRLPELNPAQLDRSRPTDTVLALLAARDIPALSLLDDFEQAGERLYFAIDGHFTPEGHALTAQLLVAWLTESGLVPTRGS